MNDKICAVPRPHLARRTLLGAAWTAPVVVAVAAAPAYAAASTDPSALRFYTTPNFDWHYAGARVKGLTTRTKVGNGTGTPTGVLTATVVITGAGLGGLTPTGFGNGWTLTSAAPVPAGDPTVLTFTHPALPAYGQSGDLFISFDHGADYPSGTEVTLSVTVREAGTGPITGSAAKTAP